MDVMKKLPLGLGLACMMMLGSCSKENVVSPEAQVGGVNENSGLKTNGPLGVVPILQSTTGTPGFNVYPTGWERRTTSFSTDLQAFPSGTSSLTHLWGSNLLPWAKPLPPIPGIQNMSSIITVSTSRSIFAYSGKEWSGVTTTIKNLKPGKQYSYTFYVASTVRNIAQGPLVPAYAKRAFVSTSNYTGGSFVTYVELEGKQAEWVKQTVTFKAIVNEATLTFSAFASDEQDFAYAHLFIDHNSLKEVN
ncbi:hypothetical protein DYBT9623_03583 [Dyadobacter sp. CECT 9623]|uniref:DUF642 domain-containing protein n=1 Tax=Dyadobacter linearis TaxID=2823330 RepID=A0ABN7RA15_9BACT|nr:hypothetical protein [Dyadobacter sp. CECT 9623]CAG5071586.1 hypothetical protein DYBT9623_03583 [Dyadobacter sp. CECT 9623]